MQLQEQIDLFTLPVELYSGGKIAFSRLCARVRSLLDVKAPEFDEAEKRYQKQATDAAMEAYDSGDFPRGERILAQYAQQARKRAEENGVDKLTTTKLEGDVRSLRLAINQGRL